MSVAENAGFDPGTTRRRFVFACPDSDVDPGAIAFRALLADAFRERSQRRRRA